MSFHKEMLKDRKANRRDRIFVVESFSSCAILLFLVFTLIFTVSAFGQLPKTPDAGKPTKSPDKTVEQAFPFTAEINGNNVLFRSGPGTNFYECGKLNKGDKVKVVSKQFSWYRIVPPPGSFAWISTKYVKPDPSDPKFGILTGDRVRVYAGSDRVPPHYSTSLLGKLNKDEKVKLMGEQLDDYYKITPPPSTYLWVSTYFTKPLPPEKTPLIAKEEQGKKKAGETTVKPLPAGAVPKVVKIDASPKPGETTDTAITETPSTQKSAVVENVIPKAPLERYQALVKLIEEEKKKPLKEEDFTQIKKDLTEIANDKSADKVAIYAKKVIALVEARELAISVIDQLKTQNEQLDKITAGIDKEKEAKLAKVKNIGEYAVTGLFKNFVLYGKGHYQIVDSSGKMLCYALPSSEIKQMDLSKFIDKKVGLKGVIQPHLPTKKAMVRFTDIVLLSGETQQRAVSVDTKGGTEKPIQK